MFSQNLLLKCESFFFFLGQLKGFHGFFFLGLLLIIKLLVLFMECRLAVLSAVILPQEAYVAGQALELGIFVKRHAHDWNRHFRFFFSLQYFNNDWLDFFLILHAVSINLLVGKSSIDIEVNFTQKLPFPLLNMAFSILSLLFGLVLCLHLL